MPTNPRRKTKTPQPSPGGAKTRPRRRKLAAVPEPPAPKPKTKYYMTRITMDLMERVEDLRPEHIPREPFIRHILSVGLDQMEEEE